MVSRSGNVLKFDGNTGAALGTFASSGLSSPYSLTFSPWDGNLYVTSFGTSSALKFDGRTGASLGTFVAASSGGLTGRSGWLLARTVISTS